MLTKFSFSTTAILLLSVWLLSACEESPEVFTPDPTSPEASALTSPERLKAVLGSPQKVPFLVKHINTFTSMENGGASESMTDQTNPKLM
jgi:hypothetical protein